MRYDSRIRPRIRVGEVLNDTNIRKAVAQWMGYQVDYSKLYDYYVGRQNPAESERNVTSNHCHYITSAIRGYMTGNAPAYAYADGDTFAETIVEEWKASSIETVESELIQSLSIYGVAYELVYRTDRGRIRSEVYPPTSAFVPCSVRYSTLWRTSRETTTIAFTHTPERMCRCGNPDPGKARGG